MKFVNINRLFIGIERIASLELVGKTSRVVLQVNAERIDTDRKIRAKSHTTNPTLSGCITIGQINPLNTKRRPLYLKPQLVPRCKHFSSGL